MIRVAFVVVVGAVVFVMATGLSPWFFIVPVGLVAIAAYERLAKWLAARGSPAFGRLADTCSRCPEPGFPCGVPICE